MPRSKPTSAPLVRDSYPNLIIQQILRAIQTGALKPGDALPSENELIQQFQVGRTSVREALAGLEYMQVVRSEGGTTYVNGDVSAFFSRKVLYHHQLDNRRQAALLETLQLLCPTFAGYAAQRAAVNNLKHLRQLLQSMDELLTRIGKEQDEVAEEELIRTHIQFHQALAEAAQNSIYDAIFQRLAPMLFSALWEIRQPDCYRALYQSCRALLQAVEQRDSKAAQSAMAAYAQTAAERYAALQACDGKERAHV